jgi:3-oxoacyl-[acyl-carrier-protein] synthase-1
VGITLSAPGVVCCAGANREELFAAVCRGDTRGIQPLSVRSGGADRRFLAGRVKETVCPPLPRGAYPACSLSESRLFAITAAALEQLRVDVEAVIAAYGPDRIGVIAGTCDNGSEFSFPAHRAFFSDGGFPAGYGIRFQSAPLIAEFIASYYGISGPCFTVATACASSAGAIVKAAEFIESGICDAVIAGGADLVSDTVLLGFSALEAVSDELTNPFSVNRKGITLGEGAAFFVMCKNSRGADAGPLIELLGWGESADAHHMTAPAPGGEGAASAMRQALSRSGLGGGAVDYINLHGTGTPLNDPMEAAALNAVFAGAVPQASSTKPVTGHTLGAAGALELAICWMTLAAAATPDSGKLPLHCWDGAADPAIPAITLVGGDTAVTPKICMSNSFAFGGCNTSLLIGRKDHD